MATNIVSYRKAFVGEGAPTDGDQLSNATFYPLDTVYTDRSTGQNYVRSGVTKTAADWTTSSGDGTTTVTVLQKRVTLTDAQIKALPSTQVQLIAPPGVGKAIILHKADLTLKFSGTGSGYTGVGTQAFIQISTPVEFLGAIVNGDSTILTGFLSGNNGVNNKTVRMFPIGGYDNTVGIERARAFDTVDYENIECHLEGWDNGGSAWTGGNAANELVVNLFYSIVDL